MHREFEALLQQRLHHEPQLVFRGGAGGLAGDFIPFRIEPRRASHLVFRHVVAHRMQDFRLTFRMVTVPGETWIFSRILRFPKPALPDWLVFNGSHVE